MDTKPIKVKVVGMQHYEGQEKSKIEMVASAEITQVDGVINLVYDESALPDKEGWSTLLEIVSGRVYLTRKDDKGNVAEKILFEKNLVSRFVMDTPMGDLDIYVETDKVDNNIVQEGRGSLIIDYRIQLGNAIRGFARMEITIL